MDDILIREAAPSDMEAMVALWKELMLLHADMDRNFVLIAEAETLFRAYLEKHFSDKDSFAVVACHENALVGYTMAIESERPPVFEKARTALISDMIVTASFRGRGIGSRLVRRVKAWARTLDVDQLEVMAATVNPQAMGFWKKMGARPYLATLVFENDEGEMEKE